MVEKKKIGNLSWKKEEGVGDTLPGFMGAQEGNKKNKITPEKILNLRGNRDFAGYIREKHGDFDGARIKFCYRAVPPSKAKEFLEGPMSEKERDELFAPTKGTLGLGSYFSTDPKRAAWYCPGGGPRVLVKVTVYLGTENVDYLVDRSKLCLQGTGDCYPTHVVYLKGSGGEGGVGCAILGGAIVAIMHIGDHDTVSTPDSDLEEGEEIVLEDSDLEEGEEIVLEDSDLDSDSEESKEIPPKEIPPKYTAQAKNIVSNGKHPVWSVKVESGEMKKYDKKQSKEIEAIHQRWQHSSNTQKWENNKGKLSKVGKWTYEISFKEYNPNSWTQENTTTEKKRIIRRSIKCSVVDAEKVPPLPYSWSFKEKEGVYTKYYHLHQVEIEDIFQRWRAGGCGRGNLSRDKGGNVKGNYLVEFVSSDKSTWKQINLDTEYSRSIYREPSIEGDKHSTGPPAPTPTPPPPPPPPTTTTPMDNEPNQILLSADSPEFKEVRDKFMSAQTHGDSLEVGSVWRIKKETGDIAFMDQLKSLLLKGEAETKIKTLYHGTSQETINSIVYKTEKTGFIKTESGMLGSGVYFAPDPGKTKYYSKDRQDLMIGAIVNLEGSKYAQNKIYDEYCVPSETLAQPTHIIRYNIKCLFCGLFINKGDAERTFLKCVHIVHKSCWQKAKVKKCTLPACAKYFTT